MAINRVVYGSTTLIDLTNDTVSASVLKTGYTAHKKDGTIVAGTFNGKRVATGSYRGTSTDRTATISGLGFKPSGATMAYITDLSNNTSIIMAITSEEVQSSGGSIRHGVRRSGSSSFTALTGNPFTATDDGFTMYWSNGNFGGAYTWVAWE